MRFGCCLNMVASGGDKTGIEHLEKLAEAGYDYVELPLAELMALPAEQFRKIKEKLDSFGLSCEVCNNFFPGWMRLTGSQVDINSIMEYVEKALARANELGAVNVVFGSGMAKQVPKGFSVKEGYSQVVNLLKLAGPVAGKNGITIVIEPLRRAECNLINTFEEGCKLATEVADGNIKVLVDFYHLSAEEEPVKHIVSMGRENLRHVHFADPEGRVYPEKQKAEYLPFSYALKKIGYDERISCEAYTDNFDAMAKKSLLLLKNIF